MRLLITGATGYVGSHVVRQAAGAGHEVHCLVRPTSDRGRIPNGATAHVHDGTLGRMNEIVAAARPEVTCHLAALVLGEHGPDDLAPLIESNIVFGAQLAEALVARGASKLVNTGTYWQHYGDADYDPVNLYAATKQAFEAVLAHYHASDDLRVITLKLFDTYGPGDRRRKLLTLLAEARATGAPLGLSPGEQEIDLVHVDDAARAYLVAAERLLAHDAPRLETFTVGADERVTLRELVALIEELVGLPLPVEWSAHPYRPREVMVPWTRGERLPGWSPRIALRDGLAELFASQ